MYRLLFWVGSLTLITQVFAQGQVDWFVQFSNDNEDGVLNASVDGEGNSYVLGFFSGTIDFSPEEPGGEVTAANLFDFYLAKYNPDGVLEWSKSIDEYPFQSISLAEIATDEAGNVVVEYYTVDEDFDAIIRVKKFNPGGVELWSRDLIWFGSEDLNQPSNIDGNVVVVDATCEDDYYEAPITILSEAGECAFLNFTYEDDPGFIVFEKYNEIDDTVFIVAILYGEVNFQWQNGEIVNVGEGSLGGSYTLSNLLLKMGLDGTLYSWQVLNEGIENLNSASNLGAGPNFVRHDSEHNMYISFSTIGEVTFGAGNNTEVINTGFEYKGVIAKYDAKGKLLWTRLEQSPSNAFLYDMDIDQNANIVLSTAIVGPYDVDPSDYAVIYEPIMEGESNLLLVIWDTDGNLVAAQDYEPTFGKVEIDPNNDFIVDGYFDRDFDISVAGNAQTVTNAGFNDGYLMKIENDFTSSIDEERFLSTVDLSIFPNPFSTKLSVMASENIEACYIYSMTGQELVKSEGLNTRTTVLDLSSLPAGMYLLNAQIGSDLLSKKIVKR